MTTSLHTDLASRVGEYAGEGAWFDEASDSKPNRVALTIEPLADGRIRKWFKHDFFEEGGATQQAVLLTPAPNGVIRLALEGGQSAVGAILAATSCIMRSMSPEIG